MKNDKDKNKNSKILAAIMIGIIFIVALIGALYFEKVQKEEKELAYTELIKDVNNGDIEKIEMTTGSTTIKVTYKNMEDGTEGTEENEKDRQKEVIVPSTQAFIELIQEKVDTNSLELELIQENTSQILKLGEAIFTFLPTILLIVLMLMLFKMQGFGGDKDKVYGGESNKKSDVRFKDIAGLDEEKNELIEIVDFLKHPKSYLEMGAKIPRGILLYGKPGTGKTLIAKAIAGEAGVPFISMSGSEFIEMFAGLGASRVRKLFDKAKKMSPAIIFIDEIDAIGARRTSNSGAETENNQTLNQLLVEMDGFETDETVIVLAATNRPEMLDKALLRPGRFDRQVTIPAPDLNGREAILKLHSENKKFSDDVDFKAIAGDTAGFTGAELANILNEAAIIATRRGHEAISNDDVESAVKKITVGLEKTNRVISDKDKKLTAYHEAGHAVVSKFLPTQSDVKEVSIIPRGVAGGYTMYKTTEDKFYVSKTELLEKMVALMGGRAAEKIALNEISTGASNDPYELQIFGEKIIDEVGKQIQILIDNSYEAAQRILRENMDILDKVAMALLEKEKISSEEFEEFFK